MAIKISGSTIIDDSRNIVNAGVTTVGVLTGTDAKFSGTVEANEFLGTGTKLSGIVTSIVAGSNISVDQSTGQVTITGLANTANVISETINTGTLNVTGITTLGGDTNISGNITSNVTLVSTDDGSAAAPEFKLWRNSASPANGDYLGQIKFAGESDTGVERNYAKITGKISDASNGTEDGIIEIAHIKDGSQNISGRWNSTTLQLINGTDFSVAGDSTFTGSIDANGTADFDLLVEMDDVNVSSALTSKDIEVSSLLTATNINATGIVSSTDGRLIAGVGVQTSGGYIGTGVTTLDFRGSGISTVTDPSSGFSTIIIDTSRSSTTRTAGLVTATSGQTVFTVPSYIVGNDALDVFVNGIKLDASEYTETNATTVTLGVGARTGDILEAYSYDVTGTEYWELSGGTLRTVINNTLVAIGTDSQNGSSNLTVGSPGVAGTTLWVNGDARITGILTVGTNTIAIDGDREEIRIGSSVILNSSSGVVTATSFVGNLTGTATTATALQTPRTIALSGDVVATPTPFDGSQNISIAATIQPNSVALGNDTTGNYIQTITGTANEITVTGSGSESADVTLSLPDDVTIGDSLTITNDATVGGAMTVGGNLSGETLNIGSGTNITTATFQSSLGGSGASSNVYIKSSGASNNGLRLRSNANTATSEGGALAATIENTESAPLRFAINGVQAMMIDTSRYVSIGNLNPTDALTINGGIDILDNFSINFGSNQGGGATINYNPNGNLDITPRSGYNSVFTSGKVGINITTPSERLHVVGKLRLNNGTDSYFDAASSNGLVITNPDMIRFEVNSGERMRINGSAQMMINTTTEGEAGADEITVANSGDAGITIRSGSSSAGNLFFSDATSGTAEYDGFINYNHNDRVLRFGAAAGEKMRVDSTGRLLVATTSQLDNAVALQLTTKYNASGNIQKFSLLHTQFTPTAAANIEFNRSRDNFGGNSAVISGSRLGQINFRGYDGSNYSTGAAIYVDVDNTPGSADMPSSIIFATSSNGSASPTSRVSITSTGVLETTNGLQLNKFDVIANNIKLVLVTGDGGSNSVQVYWNLAVGSSKAGGCLGAYKSGTYYAPTASIPSSNTFAIYGFIDT